MELSLLFLTLGHIFSFIITMSVGLFVFLKNPRGKLNVLFFVLVVVTSFYSVYFPLAARIDPSPLAYWLWFLNIFNVLGMTGYVHFMLHAIGREFEMRWYILLTYAIAIVILLVGFFMPHLFLPEVTSKLYLHSYLNPGPLYHVMMLFFMIMPIGAFIELVRAYFRGGTDRTRAEYYITTSIIGYGLAVPSFFLVYDIPVDPLFGMFVGLYTVPIAYGIVNDNLLDIRVALKRALVYGVIIGALGAILTGLLFLNNLLVTAFPSLQFWMVPLLIAVISTVVGRFVWRQFYETERLKYEFITIATHKLRTPLTSIRWEVSALKDLAGDNTELKEIARRIDSANTRLIELTNILVEAAQTENSSYTYREEPVDVIELADEVVESLKEKINEKSLSVKVTHEPGLPKIIGDPDRLHSVIEVLVENAIIYTPEGGWIEIYALMKRGWFTFTVHDSGAGISKEDQTRIFSRFFRTDTAKKIDTEGMGLGLAISKNIVEKHDGNIGVYSGGPGKGSAFWFSLPPVRVVKAGEAKKS